MFIGFDASRAFIKDRTGTENYSFQLLKALSKLDKKNQYIVYLRPFNNNAIVQLMKFPKNFRVMEIPWKRFWTQGGLALQTFKDPLNILFVPAHTIPLVRRPGLKTVVTVHDLGSEYLPSMHQLKQQLYLGFMQKYQLKNATKIITVSKATKEDLVKKVGIKPEKIEIVYEGYNQDLFKSVKGDILVNILRQFKLEAGKYFSFVGTVQPRKNLERLIQAFAIHLRGVRQVKARSHLGGGVTLVIVGSKGWLSDDIYSLPKTLGIENKVKFLGYVPNENLPALYSGAIALTFPSLFEGFGLPILEAQACGCPVLTSNVSSMPEVAGSTSLKLRGVKNGAIFVNPYDIDDIVNGMIEIMKDKTRQQLIKAGFENIKRFSWEKAAKETLKVLEKV